MAKGLYIGVDSKACKVSKLYIGVDDRPRNVKEVYVGDAQGKARLGWEIDEPLPTSFTTYLSIPWTSRYGSGDAGQSINFDFSIGCYFGTTAIGSGSFDSQAYYGSGTILLPDVVFRNLIRARARISDGIYTDCIVATSGKEIIIPNGNTLLNKNVCVEIYVKI